MYITSDYKLLINQQMLQQEFQKVQAIHQYLVILEAINKITSAKIYHNSAMVHHTVIQSDGKYMVITQYLVATSITMFLNLNNLNVIQYLKTVHLLFHKILHANVMSAQQLKAKTGFQ
jgi:hypothetical protein